jgi:hypothetical protein
LTCGCRLRAEQGGLAGQESIGLREGSTVAKT